MRRIRKERMPLARFPVTEALYSAIRLQRGKTKDQPQYVSPGLLDHVFERVSPYLRRNPPVDILDLWPGGGFCSSRLNELIKPRRHILVEPNHAFHGLLTRLAKSKPCYKLVDDRIYGKADWSEFFATHLPEQGPGNREGSAIIPRNDTLLIMANLPDAVSPTDHFKPNRWFLSFMKSCLEQNGLNLYGAVRVIASLPFNGVSNMLPRSTTERTRTGVFAETIGLHNIEIATPAETENSLRWQGWDYLNDNRKLVAERAAANNIITPPDRELPPLKLVPEVVHRGKKEIPNQPRVLSDVHQRLLADIAAADELGLSSSHETTDPNIKAIIRRRGIAFTHLTRENSAHQFREKLVNIIIKLDELGRSFARAAADPKESVESLKALEDQIISLKSSYTTLISTSHWTIWEKHNFTIDDLRFRSVEAPKNGGLVHDRRPFEPLYIDPEEIYPRGSGRGVIYFEADPNPPVLKKAFDLPSAMVQPVLDRYYGLLAFVSNKMPVAELLTTLFPNETINSHVRDIPSLANFAERRLKPGYGPMPLPDGSTSDPAFSYQENVDYDLSGVRLRILSAETLLDIAIKYEKLPDKLPAFSFSRALGGTLTQAQLCNGANNPTGLKIK
ncbi:hypothetical protein DTO012A7_6427 [Penicillium roqueforti]|uniref:uncharacterized protein n=1 Tax=Penicillium roqueforti TaxID=5082 RepID=UPI00190BD187|nr:uncharacterized protein LCP9604111_242 [Penicillium roqueforti]KAF9252716.1 hypothetical protein LCP9604111_242 [Penicillium roqueforti]KAI2675382.1 hypothetical protein CBS147355_6376 [Penicillium roqueforti]KAI2686997.1 hypothetical protein LCP963914a_3598 [Penicillium roqueforti]KAI2724272.1 hypothetical protein CBS147318_1203 [Penicillium roqueforti]KAI3119842.1 hypothetical protein CBS147326_9676 [Penicillium roqueforti]